MAHGLDAHIESERDAQFQCGEIRFFFCVASPSSSSNLNKNRLHLNVFCHCLRQHRESFDMFLYTKWKKELIFTANQMFYIFFSRNLKEIRKEENIRNEMRNDHRFMLSQLHHQIIIIMTKTTTSTNPKCACAGWLNVVVYTWYSWLLYCF